MANRVAPPRIDALNSAGSLRAALTDWRTVRRFHVGTGHTELTTDAGYLGPPLWGIRLHALPTCQIYRSVSLLFGGVHIRRVRFLYALSDTIPMKSDAEAMRNGNAAAP